MRFAKLPDQFTIANNTLKKGIPEQVDHGMLYTVKSISLLNIHIVNMLQQIT